MSLIFRTYFWVKLEILVKENFSVFRIVLFIYLWNSHYMLWIRRWTMDFPVCEIQKHPEMVTNYINNFDRETHFSSFTWCSKKISSGCAKKKWCLNLHKENDPLILFHLSIWTFIYASLHCTMMKRRPVNFITYWSTNIIGYKEDAQQWFFFIY